MLTITSFYLFTYLFPVSKLTVPFSGNQGHCSCTNVKKGWTLASLNLILFLLNNCKITPIKSCHSFDSLLPMSENFYLVLYCKIQHFNTEILSYVARFNTSTLPTPTHPTFLMQVVHDTLSGVLAVRKLHNGGDLPLDSLFQVPLTGVQPRLDPGISSGGRRWRKDSKGERQRLDLTGLRGKPIKFVTPNLLWPRRPQAPSRIAEGTPP